MNNQNKKLRAGVGKADITCREEGCWEDLLSDKVKKHIPPDYLRKQLKVSDPLFVRALVLDDGDEQLVLVTMDVTAIGARTISQNILADSADDFVPKLRARVEREFGLPGDHVSVSASHTHQVPRMLCDDEAQIEQALAAIRQAKDNRVPVWVGAGSGCEHGLTVNRTMMMKDGTDHTMRHTPVPPDEEVAGLRPVDPEIGVLRIDRVDGRPLALVYNFAAHLLLGAPDGEHGTITADHVGVTLRHLEDNLGGDAMAFCLQGALGDVAEVCQYDIEHPFRARDFGVSLGHSIAKIHAGIATGPAELALVRKQTMLPLRKDIPEIIARLRKTQADMTASLQYTTLNFKTFLPLYLKYSQNTEYPSHWPLRYLHDEDCGDTARKLMDERNRSAIAKYLESIRTMECMAIHEENIATLQKQQEVIEALGVDEVPAEFLGIKIGDFTLLTAPLEILTEVGLKVKGASPFEHTYVVSLANGYYHYAPPASYYERGGYEATECLLAPEWEKSFEHTVREIFGELQSPRAPKRGEPSLSSQ